MQGQTSSPLFAITKILRQGKVLEKQSCSRKLCFSFLQVCAIEHTHVSTSKINGNLGGDTTSTLLTATFFYLSRYPRIYERLAHEIRSHFTDGMAIKSGEKLSECTYLRACLDEALRMNPPIGSTPWRELPADANTDPILIDGHLVPPGTHIGVNIYTLHHKETYFPEPFVFKPERWLPEESQLSPEQTKLMHYAFSPFSIGARACAGKSMVYLEASLVLAKTLWYFDFEIPTSVGGTDIVFRTGDVVNSTHTGPELRFRTRGDMWKDLFENQADEE